MSFGLAMRPGPVPTPVIDRPGGGLSSVSNLHRGWRERPSRQGDKQLVRMTGTARAQVDWRTATSLFSLIFYVGGTGGAAPKEKIRDVYPPTLGQGGRAGGSMRMLVERWVMGTWGWGGSHYLVL